MAKQMLFYELVTPISRQRHENWSVKEGASYDFAAGANSVPLMTAEFTAAAHEFPIVFSADGDTVMPVAILGLDADKGLFVDPAGKWSGGYIPAFIRRYPFVFSGSDDGQTLTLCIDESYEGFDRKGRSGQRLFDDGGNRTPYLERMLEFVQACQGEHQRTRMFGDIIKGLDILEPSQAKVNLPDGSERSLSGFHCISRDKLKALATDQIEANFRNDVLELIYLHLYSMRSFDGLMRKLAGVVGIA